MYLPMYIHFYCKILSLVLLFHLEFYKIQEIPDWNCPVNLMYNTVSYKLGALLSAIRDTFPSHFSR